MIDLIQKACDQATHYHRDQRYGENKEHPYTFHLNQVVEVLKRFGYGDDIDLMCAAWLHDAVEDTDAKLYDICREFGFRTMGLVYSVTNEPGKNRRERNERTYPKINGIPGAIILKLADRIANVEYSIQTKSPILEMYEKEFPGFKQALNTDEHVCWEMWDHLEAILKPIQCECDAHDPEGCSVCTKKMP